MFTKIPFFKEILIGSFSCDDCGNRNNEVNFVGELPSRGISIKFKVTEKSDLNREVVKSEHASIRFEELDLELPETNRADINTI
jgi:zinc finger protein